MSGALLFPLAGTGAHVVRFVLKYRYERHDSPLRTIVAFAMPGECIAFQTQSVRKNTYRGMC